MKIKMPWTNATIKKGVIRGVEKTSDIISRNPEAASLSETLVKRFTTYAHIGEKIIHFHHVIFGLMLGFSMMTGIIAIGKLLSVLEVSIFNIDKDLALSFGYFSFFSCVCFGFFKHYQSSHHKRLIQKRKTIFEQEFDKKQEDLKREFKEKKESLEEAFIERSKKLGAMIREQDEELQHIKKQISMATAKLDEITRKITRKEEKKSTWNSISDIYPRKNRNKD